MAAVELEEWLPPLDDLPRDDHATNGYGKTGSVAPPIPEHATSSQDWLYPHPTDFVLSERPIDEVRPLKVAVIGAGLTGITAGILLPIKVPCIKLTILEKNSDVVSEPEMAVRMRSAC